MPTLLLLKDDPQSRDKAGSTVSRPFLRGREMVEQGIAVNVVPKSSREFAQKQDSEIMALRAEVARLQTENAQLKTDCDVLVKENDELGKQIEELTTPKKLPSSTVTSETKQ